MNSNSTDKPYDISYMIESPPKSAKLKETGNKLLLVHQNLNMPLLSQDSPGSSEGDPRAKNYNSNTPNLQKFIQNECSRIIENQS